MSFARFTMLGVSIIFALAAVPWLPHPVATMLLLTGTTLAFMGFSDLCQTRHSIRRNYPVLGRIRWLIEGIRPEIRQYLIENDTDRNPFSRSQRSLVYARAKDENSDRPLALLWMCIKTAASSSLIRPSRLVFQTSTHSGL